MKTTCSFSVSISWCARTFYAYTGSHAMVCSSKELALGLICGRSVHGVQNSPFDELSWIFFCLGTGKSEFQAFNDVDYSATSCAGHTWQWILYPLIFPGGDRVSAHCCICQIMTPQGWSCAVKLRILFHIGNFSFKNTEWERGIKWSNSTRKKWAHGGRLLQILS